MSALHEAVTRAIRDARRAKRGDDWRAEALDAAAATAAIGVVLADAERSIRALPARGDVAFGCVERVEALAALAALAGEAA